MKTKLSVLLVLVGFLFTHTVVAQGRSRLISVVGTTEECLWPCEGSENLSTNQEIDQYFTLDSSGSENIIFNWGGTCPAINIESDVPVPDDKLYDIRLGSDEPWGVFYESTDYSRVMGYPAQDISDKFTLYVPDSRLDEFVQRGLNPVPFSEVTDWSWEEMLGASPSDTVAQWIGRNIELGGYYVYRSELTFGMRNIYIIPPIYFLFGGKSRRRRQNIKFSFR